VNHGVESHIELSTTFVNRCGSCMHCMYVCMYICLCLCAQELVVALSGFVCQFETQFASLAYQLSEAEKEREYHTVTGTVGVWNSPKGFYFITVS